MIDTNKFVNVDKNNGRIKMPKLTLMTKSFETIGNIPHFSNWNISVIANGLDEISFDVHKYVNNELCPIWDDIEDLKVVDVNGEARFEIDVDYTDDAQTVKSVHGQSLECELGQIMLYEFHVNDEDAMIYNETLLSNSGDILVTGNFSNDFDINGIFIPTVFCKPNDVDHSLLHRVIKDKAPHWTIGHVPNYITMDEEDYEAELSTTFQRTYTVDGTSIYDFLTGEVAKESNVVFIFDTVHRRINCYSLTDGYITNNQSTVISSGSVNENPTSEEQDDGTYLFTQEKLDINVSTANMLKFDKLVDSIVVKMESTEEVVDVSDYSFTGRGFNDFIADGSSYTVKVLSISEYDEMTITNIEQLNQINDPPTIVLFDNNNSIIGFYKIYNNLTFDITDASYICLAGRHGCIFTFSCKSETKNGGQRLTVQDNPSFMADIDVKNYDTLSFGDISYINENDKPNILLIKNNRVIGNYVLSSSIEELDVYSATDLVFMGLSGATFDYRLELKKISNQFALTTSSKDMISVEGYDKISIKAAYFDTDRQTINYQLLDMDKQSGARILVEDAVGEDTTVLISKDKLAQEIGIDSNKDEIKNCFRVMGGDEMINAAVAAVNMTGSNYIYQFADFQLNDMSEELRTRIIDYQQMIEDNRDDYEALYSELNDAYEQLSYYQSVMAPNTALSKTNAKTAYADMVDRLTETGFSVAVNDLDVYSDISYAGITSNIKAMAEVLSDSRFTVEIVRGSTEYNPENQIWRGQIQLTRTVDKDDVYPKTDSQKISLISVHIIDCSNTQDELEYVKQKIMKKLEEAELSDIYFHTLNISETEARRLFEQYSLSRLESYRDAFEGCCSTILAVKDPKDQSDILKQLYNQYRMLFLVVEDLVVIRANQVNNIKEKIDDLEAQNKEFQERMNFVNYLGEKLFKEFSNYIREDEYQNDNYISDNLETTEEYLSKAKELLDTAQKEIKKACVLQRTVSASCKNMVLLPEFRALFNKFNLFNYIRVKTDDEIFRLRIAQIDFEGGNFQDIKVTFNENIETLDSKISDTESILQQAESISTSYSATMLQASQGTKANDFVRNLYANGLNAAKTMITNADSNEVTINSSGLLARRMDDTGLYGDKQLRIIGNGIYMTDDNWNSVKMAIGETTFINPITQQSYQDYGLIAPNIVGELIAGNKLIISAKDGDLVIDENGLTLADDQAITFQSGGLVKVSEFDDYKSAVYATLTGGGSSVITQDSIISPKIGGGYLYIADDHTQTSIEINPTGKPIDTSSVYNAVGTVQYQYDQGPSERINCGSGDKLSIQNLMMTKGGVKKLWDRDEFGFDYNVEFANYTFTFPTGSTDYEHISNQGYLVYSVEISSIENMSCYYAISNTDTAPSSYTQLYIGNNVTLTDIEIQAGKVIWLKILCPQDKYEDETINKNCEIKLYNSNVLINYGHYEHSSGYGPSVFVGETRALHNFDFSREAIFTFEPTITTSPDDFYMIQIFGSPDIVGGAYSFQYWIPSGEANKIIQVLREGEKIFHLDSGGNINISGTFTGSGNFTNQFSVGATAESKHGGGQFYNGIFDIQSNYVQVGSAKNFIRAGANDTQLQLYANNKLVYYSNNISNTIRQYYNSTSLSVLTSTYRNQSGYGHQDAVWIGGNSSNSIHDYTNIRGDYIRIANSGKYAVNESNWDNQYIQLTCYYKASGQIFSGGSIKLDYSGTYISQLILSNAMNANNKNINDIDYAYANHFNMRSDKRIKDVYSFNNSLEVLFNLLKPIEYIYSNDETQQKRLGFVAQDVEQSFNDVGLDINQYGIIGYNKGMINDKEVDDLRTLSYMDFIPLNTYMIQKLMKRVDDLENELKEIKNGE